MKNSILKDDSGVSSLMFAMVLPSLLMFAALVVDIDTFYLKKRALQGATDLAAIGAALNPTQGATAAQTNLVLNGFPASALQSLQVGNFTSDSTLAPAQRFVAAASGTAVQITTQVQTPYYFASVMKLLGYSTCSGTACTSAQSATSAATISATATAMMDPEAAIGIGSDLANLNGGILNAVLGGLLGTNLSFSTMDYQSLASANVDLFSFSNDLATRLNLTGVTYNQLAQTQVAAPTLLAALKDSSQGGASVGNDLATLASAAPSTTIALGQLVSFGEYGAMTTNSSLPITAKASVMDMVSAIAELASGAHQIQAPLSVSMPPVASATLALTIGERAVNSGFFAIGSQGVSVHTAQTRLLLTLQIAQSGSTSLINLPIYMELAPATATLSSVSCPADITQATATLAVTPGVVNAWIGNVTSAAMTNFSTEPTPSAAALVTLPLIGSVSGRANANISNPTSVSVLFTYSDYLDLARKSTTTADYLSPLLYSLLANLQLTVTVAGVSVTAPAAVTTTLGTTLATAVSPADTIISQVLETLGVTVGNAYTWLGGIKCGPARLVL